MLCQGEGEQSKSKINCLMVAYFTSHFSTKMLSECLSPGWGMSVDVSQLTVPAETRILLQHEAMGRGWGH